MMNCKKQDLYDFIGDKTNKLLSKAKKEKHQALVSFIENNYDVEIFEKYENKYDSLKKSFTKELERNGLDYMVLNELNNRMTSRRSVLESLTEKLQRASERFDDWSFSMTSLKTADQQKNFKNYITPFNDKVEKIRKLDAELEKVIRNARNGSIAYKELVALGVDMTGFEPTAQLPAVTKLSVDVCIINDDCGKADEE